MWDALARERIVSYLIMNSKIVCKLKTISDSVRELCFPRLLSWGDTYKKLYIGCLLLYNPLFYYINVLHTDQGH